MVKDSARSWLVLLVVTFSMFLEVGTIKAFSVLLPDIEQQLDTHLWIVGSSIAIMTGFGYTFGLLTDSIIKLFSPRVCVMASGLIATVGLIVCSFATNSFTLLFGLILSGFLLVQETVVQGIIPDYFERYYETAVGIYSCGTALAILTFPLATQLVLDVYGWKGTLLLISGIVLHSIPCGALLKSEKSRASDYEPILDHQSTSNDKGPQLSLVRHFFKTLGLHLLTSKDFVTRVFIPALVLGYTLTGWLIYMVSFVVSKNASLKEATIVVTSGGFGMMTVRIGIFLLHKIMTYKQLVYLASVTMTLSMILMTVFTGLIALNIISVIFGAAIGVLGTELFISAKINSHESEHFLAIAWLNLAHGLASILSGFVTGIIFDMTGSFTLSFNILAGASLVTAISLGFGDIF
ncbi:monocarboxylate transporter 13-like [Amphiura filiformis]|uniref:monocarboxylate transporter 13-like n=1 Tax=Amphiura filiformis TaxID=82378 RepID=UPI003B21C495